MTSVWGKAENHRESQSMLLVWQKHLELSVPQKNAPQWKLKKITNIILLLSSFQSAHLSVCAGIFPVCTFCLGILIFYFPLFPHSLSSGEEDQSNSSVRVISSPAPYQRSLCLSSCPSQRSLVNWKQISPVRPPSSPIQSDYSWLDAIGVSVCLSFFFLSVFLPFGLSPLLSVCFCLHLLSSLFAWCTPPFWPCEVRISQIHQGVTSM